MNVDPINKFKWEPAKTKYQKPTASKDFIPSYVPPTRSKVRKMNIHCNKGNLFSFEPIDSPPHRHPFSIQSDKRDEIPSETQAMELMRARRRQSVYTQWSGVSSDKKDSFDSSGAGR